MSQLIRLALLDLLRIRNFLPILQPRLYTTLHIQGSLGLPSRQKLIQPKSAGVVFGVNVSPQSGSLWERGLGLA